MPKNVIKIFGVGPPAPLLSYNMIIIIIISHVYPITNCDVMSNRLPTKTNTTHRHLKSDMKVVWLTLVQQWLRTYLSRSTAANGLSHGCNQLVNHSPLVNQIALAAVERDRCVAVNDEESSQDTCHLLNVCALPNKFLLDHESFILQSFIMVQYNII